MRLFHAKEHILKDFIGQETVKYAILSHTWGVDEVVFKDLQTRAYKNKLSWKKIEYCCRQAMDDKIDWVWIDTICIDKSSSAELSEAINSMFTWYHEAEVCYAYMADVPKDPDGRLARETWQDCRWFSRGWTLQELLAPCEMVFYGEGWQRLGTRKELCELISEVSGIQTSALGGDQKEIGKLSIAKRMCWASQRKTTRPEDIAYCLLGIFGVNMPLLYGEGGERAFLRLQEEIMKDSDDHTLFAWEVPEEEWGYRISAKEVGLLAEHPELFRFSEDVLAFRRWDVSETFSMTNKGLKIMVPMTANESSPNIWAAYLDCYHIKGNQEYALAIPLKQLSPGGDQYARVSGTILDFPLSLEQEVGTDGKREIYIRKEIIKPEDAFQETAFRLREFKLLPVSSTHHLLEVYGCSRQGPNLDRLCAPLKASYYWIDPLAWTDWRVVCRYKMIWTGPPDVSQINHDASDFIVVLGYNTNTARPWCIIEYYDPTESLQQTWGRITYDTHFGTAHTIYLKDGTLLVRVSMELGTQDPGIVEVEVNCCHGPGKIAEGHFTEIPDSLSFLQAPGDSMHLCHQIINKLQQIELFGGETLMTKIMTSPTPGEMTEVMTQIAMLDLSDYLKAMVSCSEEMGTVFCLEMEFRSAIPTMFLMHSLRALESFTGSFLEFEVKLDVSDISGGLPQGITFTHEFPNLGNVWIKTMLSNPFLDCLNVFRKVLEMSILMVKLYKYHCSGYSSPAQSFGILSHHIKTAELDIIDMLKRSQRYKDTNHSDVAHLITAVNHLRTFVQAATKMVAEYQPLLEGYAEAQQMKPKLDTCDTVSLSPNSQQIETPNIRGNKRQDEANILKPRKGWTLSTFRTKK